MARLLGIMYDTLLTGAQYDPRGFVFISEMVSGVYVVQFDEDYDSRFDYPLCGRRRLVTNEINSGESTINSGGFSTSNPVASAHGANSFSFIMRNGSLQPESAGVE